MSRRADLAAPLPRFDAARHDDVRGAAPVPPQRPGTRRAPTGRGHPCGGRRLGRRRRIARARTDDDRTEGDLADIDVSLDWPKTARTLMKTVAGSEIGAVDGVISIDAVALQDLVWMIGDVEADGMALSDETTTTGVEIDPFLGNNPPKAARVHAVRVSQILEAFLDRRPGVESFALADRGRRPRETPLHLSPGRRGAAPAPVAGPGRRSEPEGRRDPSRRRDLELAGQRPCRGAREDDRSANGHDPAERVRVGRGGGPVRRTARRRNHRRSCSEGRSTACPWGRSRRT